MKRVLWLTNVPSQYRVDFFNVLGKKCKTLFVLFEKRTNTVRKNLILENTFKFFEYRFLNGISVSNNMALSPAVIRYLWEYRNDIIVVHNPASPTGILAIQYLKFHNIRYFIESDGGMPGNGKGFKEWLKKINYSGAFGYYTTSELGRKQLQMYGAKEGDIYIYPFTSLFMSDILKEPLTGQEKADVRSSLKINYDKVILSVGQFIPRKGFDLLLKAVEGIEKSVGVIIIGDAPKKEYVQYVREKEMTNVMFVDFKDKNELWRYYQAADLFVLPTRYDIWGLVINEAMANALPVISTTNCVSATELIRDGDNGYLYEAENVLSLHQLIVQVLNDDIFCNKASLKSLEIIKSYTFENMAQFHLEQWKTIEEK